MSTKAVTDFFTKAATDEEITALLQGDSLDEKINAAVHVGAENGFDFTPEECLQVINTSRGNTQLSEDQLEDVAGGGIGHLFGTVLAWMESTFVGGNSDEEGSSVGVGVRA